MMRNKTDKNPELITFSSCYKGKEPHIRVLI